MTKTKVKAKTIRKITENDIKRQVKDYLSLKGWFHFYNLAGMGAYKGIPDIIAIKQGRVLFIECKRPARGSKQSPAQIKFQENIEAQGGEYLLVRDVEDLVKAKV
jgi:Holliday junction resolvase